MSTEKQKTLPEVLGAYAARDMARFHMPGHKGFGIPMQASLAAWDVTELPGTDNLHMPKGAIAETERRYAQAYGARDCFLLINGSTAGALAMLLALGENRRVLLARNCHRSALSGAILANHSLSFLNPPPEGMPAPADVDAALTKERADAVYIVSPDSYGRCADIAGIAQAARRHGALLLVDAAHGAHFPFCKALSALCPREADMFCVSAHKTLGAFTQAALLFTGKSCPFDRARIQAMLSLVQSTSPSYPLMVSLDWALHSAKGWDAQVERIQALSARLAAANGIRVQDAACAGRHGVFAIDPTRLVLDVRGRGISGKAALESLLDQGVCPELADTERVVFITSPQDPDAWYGRLAGAVEALPYGTDGTLRTIAQPPPAEGAMPLREAALAPSVPLPLAKSAGRVAAAPVGLYPPGVAALLPGERIGADMAAYLEALLREGYSIFGLEGDCIRVVQ